MVGYGIFLSVILATYSNPWGRGGEVIEGYGTSGRGCRGRVVGAVGVRNPYLSSELPDRPETTFIPFLVSSSPCSTPLVFILTSPLVPPDFPSKSDLVFLP